MPAFAFSCRRATAEDYKDTILSLLFRLPLYFYATQPRFTLFFCYIYEYYHAILAAATPPAPRFSPPLHVLILLMLSLSPRDCLLMITLFRHDMFFVMLILLLLPLC